MGGGLSRSLQQAWWNRSAGVSKPGGPYANGRRSGLTTISSAAWCYPPLGDLTLNAPTMPDSRSRESVPPKLPQLCSIRR